MRKWLLAAGIIAAGVAAYVLFRQTGAGGSPLDAKGESSAEVSGAGTAGNPSLVPGVTENPPATPASPSLPKVPAAAVVPGALGAAVGSTAPQVIGQHGLDFTNLPPATVVQQMATAIHSYCSMFNGNPVGTNPEIAKALDGDNPRQAHFLQPEAGMRLNESGELIDPWGTPYFFHQLSGTDMEVRSAGPDKIMWTKDDVVAR
jgi:hypothetical protein